MMEAGTDPRPVQFPVAGTSLHVSGLWTRPPTAGSLCVLAHGAGAGMDHPFMTAVADRLAAAGVASLRYQFPYMEAGRRRPDPPHLLQATVRSAAAFGLERAERLPVFCGGKSMGGRMSSRAAAEDGLPDVKGLIFLGFPLHPPGRASIARAEHLSGLDLPMLFLQGTRDPFAQPDLLRLVCDKLGPRATLHVVEDGDHSFKVRKRSGRSEAEVLDELAETITGWIGRIVEVPPRHR